MTMPLPLDQNPAFQRLIQSLMRAYPDASLEDLTAQAQAMLASEWSPENFSSDLQIGELGQPLDNSLPRPGFPLRSTQAPWVMSDLPPPDTNPEPLPEEEIKATPSNSGLSTGRQTPDNPSPGSGDGKDMPGEQMGTVDLGSPMQLGGTLGLVTALGKAVMGTTMPETYRSLTGLNPNRYGPNATPTVPGDLPTPTDLPTPGDLPEKGTAAALGEMATKAGSFSSLASAIAGGHPIGTALDQLDSQLSAMTPAEAKNAVNEVASLAASLGFSPNQVAALASDLPGLSASFSKGAQSVSPTPENMSGIPGVMESDKPGMAAFGAKQQEMGTLSQMNSRSNISGLSDTIGQVATAMDQQSGLKSAADSLFPDDMQAYFGGMFGMPSNEPRSPDSVYADQASFAMQHQDDQNDPAVNYSPPDDPTGLSFGGISTPGLGFSPNFNDSMFGAPNNPTQASGFGSDISPGLQSRADAANAAYGYGAPAVGINSGIMGLTNIGFGQLSKDEQQAALAAQQAKDVGSLGIPGYNDFDMSGATSSPSLGPGEPGTMGSFNESSRDDTSGYSGGGEAAGNDGNDASGSPYRRGGKVPMDRDGKLEARKAIVHEGETWLSPEATAHWEDKYPGLLAYMNKIGNNPESRRKLAVALMRRAA